MKRFLPWVAVVVALALAAAVGTLVMPWTPPSDPQPVTASVARLCPAAYDATGDQTLAAWSDSGTLTTAPLDAPEQTSTPDGLAWTTADAPTVVRLPDTPAYAASAAVAADKGPERGLSATACVASTTDAWFTGLRSDDSHQTSVELVNLDGTDAEASLTFYGPDGIIPSPGSRGLTVPAQGSRTVSVGPLISSSDPVTVQVHATAGRLAVLVRERRWNGTKPLGSDWVRESALPGTSLVIPGIPAGKGDRSLVLTNPGERVVQADIQILGDAGAYQPVGAESIDIPAGATRVLDLAAGLNSQSGSVQVEATGDVTAAVEVTRVGRPPPMISWSSRQPRPWGEPERRCGPDPRRSRAPSCWPTPPTRRLR